MKISGLNKWKLISKKTGKDVTNQYKFITGWQITIRAMLAIWRKLKSVGYEYLCTRNFNQDPVENLFCCIRQHGIANTNPTCYQFISALKTCVVNNLEKSIHVSSNCENDSDKLLNNLRNFLTTSSSSTVKVHAQFLLKKLNELLIYVTKL
jgi:hypothetical protein